MVWTPYASTDLFRPTARTMNLRTGKRPPNVTRALATARQGLGPLESRVLGLLWDHGRAATVRDVHGAVPELAYTTIMTTLDRLYRKGVLIRQQRGRAFTYEPRCSPTALLGELISGHFAALIATSATSTAVLSTLVQAVGRRDVSLLDELDALVQAERERLRAEET